MTALHVSVWRGGAAGRLQSYEVPRYPSQTVLDVVTHIQRKIDPSLAYRSLGTYMILDHMRAAKIKRVPYVYLGYWVRGSRKMDYKARFQPLEALGSSGWKRLPPDAV